MNLINLTYLKIRISLCYKGNEKDPTWESRKKLPYTCAFMDEVYRTVCPLSRTVTHDTNTNIKLANFTIPKGEEVFDYDFDQPLEVAC